MADVFHLEAVRARHGDCLILHYGPEERPDLILIDGGPSRVYREHLRPRLEELRRERGLADDQPLEFRMLMVSHIDDDHIRGILDLFQEERERQLDRKPPRYLFDTVWHNSFDDLVGQGAFDLEDAALAAFRARRDSDSVDGGGHPEPIRRAALGAAFGGHRDESHGPGGEAVAASVPQGRDCRRLARVLGLPLNRGRPRPAVQPAAHGPDPLRHLVLARPGQRSVDLGHGLTFRILGPSEKRVRRLHTIWDRELERRGLAADPDADDEPTVEPAAFVDRSVFNLASLIVLAEKDGKSMLLCGDARGDDILEGFAEAGLLGPGGQGTFSLHLMKLPHHGSDRNVTTQFFRQLPADHYLISGDGRHGNPEPNTLRMLKEAREPDGRPYRIEMTYGLDELHPKFPVEELRGLLGKSGIRS